MSLGLFHCQGRLDFSFLGCCVRSQVWRLSDFGFKVNVDAALDKTRGIFSLGVVARDRLGKLSWARAKCYNGSIEPKTTETLAIIDGVNSAVSENLNLSLWNPTLSMLLTFVQVVPCLNARWSILFKMSMILLGRVPTISLYVSRTDLVIQLTIVLLCGL
ncbi:hypothetical protein QYF36_021170 [Acer negundo]|nr:hypothetical protein QYF36_021170 [Acer negundo]